MAGSNLFTVLRACALSMASLYVGFYLGYKEGVAVTSRMLSDGGVICSKSQSVNQEDHLQAPLTASANGGDSASTSCPPCPETSASQTTTTSTPSDPLFPPGTGSYVAGMSLVDRDEFSTQFDEIGVPLSTSGTNNNQVLILHGKKSMPNDSTDRSPNRHLNTQQATENCNYMSLVLTEPNRFDQCIAIMGQYNSYHIFKHMRTQPAVLPAVLKKELPLKLVKRGMDVRPFHTKTPNLSTTKTYWSTTLQPYLANYQTYLERLKPIARQAASTIYKDTIIVMVSNHGQSEMLVNFVCNAQARDLSLASVLVFATDPETEQLSKGLGLHTFYDQELFAQIPKQHAARFGDQTYKLAIFSKLYCVHLVGLLGYDYLFQDIDMIWYRHPLEYFHNSNNNKQQPLKFDMYMQTDGNMAQFYAPYSGNTGFYYVRNSQITQYFMNHFLVSGDLILSTSTHQAPFLTVLSEHASLHGLKVKILLADEFPGGAHYNRDYKYMKYLMNVTQPPPGVTIDPWIFHMSWTESKANKILFYQQMGEWYVQDHCVGSTVTDILGQEGAASTVPTETIELPASPFRGGATPLTKKCCTAKPNIKCHFRDTPSIIPCHDSPAMNKGRESFHPIKK
ncbi:Nucleotide-diphospho-sugar transferase [Seminavis robusta]|uniref:Nucleotide-diphospho-sugar transferase n=1 Tax=Seminavis robusta TaxID=568900 RepID=A0A9N8DR87_9STRA|nr:Nucleotide-diphospho-sugar transferase [Seminavis robusta]|eukprot:Sro198_g084060.1 Nucleotide-diphospho-sugar transferase (621) ;mRNA; r:40281-42351